MKILLSTTLFLFIGLFASLGQNPSNYFDQVGKDEIELTTYSKDKNAEAVVLFNRGSSRFVRNESSFDITFKQSKRIKILSEAGIKYAEIEIPYYREGDIYEKIIELTAYTYNYEDGFLTKTELKKEDMHDERVNEYWMVRKFAMPNVKAGSIIDLTYTITTPYIFNLRDWSFQEKIPTIYSEYTVRMIPFYEYSYILQGASQLDSHNSYEDSGFKNTFAGVTYNDYIHKFVMKDVPAFESEEYITSMNDYIMKIDFQLAKIHFPTGGDKEIISTWPDMVKTMVKHADFGKFIKKCEKLAPKIIDVNALLQKPEKDRFEEVVDFVKNNFNWNEHYGKFASKSAGNMLDDKFGNSADINLLTIGLLNAVEIEAYPLLISTRDHGKILVDYPYSHFFNNVIIFAKPDNFNILSDATELNNSAFRIPPSCINDKGLLVREDEEVAWIGLQSEIPSRISTFIQLKLNDNEMEASVKTSATEYEALELRNDIGNDVEKLIEKLNKKNYTTDKESVKIRESVSPKEDYSYEFSPQITPEEIANKLYIAPFLNEPIDDNPFNQEKRTYPIDMVYPWKRIYSSTFEIPENYQVDFIPENFTVKNNLAEIEYRVMQSESNIVVSLSIYFKKSVYPADDYSKIKYYFNEIVKKGNEKIVLVKQ